jgi:F-type H+-transporting ATPase subunit epsilon
VRPGVLEIYADNENTVTERIFVAGGFAEVTNERCTVLAEEATPVESLDRAKIEESLRDLLDDMTTAENDHERAAIEKRLVLVRAQLQAVA